MTHLEWMGSLWVWPLWRVKLFLQVQRAPDGQSYRFASCVIVKDINAKPNSNFVAEVMRVRTCAYNMENHQHIPENRGFSGFVQDSYLKSPLDKMYKNYRPVLWVVSVELRKGQYMVRRRMNSTHAHQVGSLGCSTYSLAFKQMTDNFWTPFTLCSG